MLIYKKYFKFIPWKIQIIDEIIRKRARKYEIEAF